MPATLDRPRLSNDQKKEVLLNYRKNPMLYVDNVLLPRLGLSLEKGQREVIEDIFKYHYCLIPTHFAFGKDFICALVSLTLLNLYPNDCRGTGLAPTFSQVQDILFVEIRDMFTRINADGDVLQGKITLTRYDIGVKCFMVGLSPRRSAKGAAVPQFLSGKHGRVNFIIGDEAGALEDQIFEQVDNITNTAGETYIIYIGNPLNKHGRFGRMCLSGEGTGFHITHKTAYESPNMAINGLTNIDALRKEAEELRTLSTIDRMFALSKTSGRYKIANANLLSPYWVMQKFLAWGESQLFFSKVIGLWTDQTQDTLIPYERACEIMLGTYTQSDGTIVWESEDKQIAKWDGILDIAIGSDCSGEGTDWRTVAVYEGNREIAFKKFPKTYERNELDYRGIQLKENGDYIANWINTEILRKYSGRKTNIGIDTTGGFGDELYGSLMRLRLDPVFVTIYRITFGAKADNEELYSDNIAEMADEFKKEIMSENGILLQPNEDLKNQMTDRKITQGTDRRLMLESKKNYKARHNNESPDDFDAHIIANRMRMHRKPGKIDDAMRAITDSMVKTNKAYQSRNKKDW
jgi:hypothetical protein